MTTDQGVLFLLMGSVLALLVWGRLRYDVVAFGALVVGLVSGVVEKEAAFSGFGHPATVIIALVLVISRGLIGSGVVGFVARFVVRPDRSLAVHVGLMSALAAALSAVMNNVAALALLLPVELQAARRANRSPAVTLMAISFASILGGMMTLIGTPPNVVIATFRGSVLGRSYGMLDFTPVGFVVAAVGIVYVALFGWRLIPIARRRTDSGRELEDLSGFVAEAQVDAGSSVIGQRIQDLDEVAEENDVVILGLVRRGKRLPGTARAQVIGKSDHLVLEGAPQAIESFIRAVDLKLTATAAHDGMLADTLEMLEVVVPVGARIDGRSARNLRLLARRRVMLLGVSRRGVRFQERVRKLTIKAGDILLLVGPEEQLADAMRWLGCLPLAPRGLQVTQPRKAGLAAGIFTAAILVASFEWLDLTAALAAATLLFVLLRIVPLAQIYDSVEWPVIVLLGSLIPIGAALHEKGGTALIASSIVSLTDGLPPVVVLAVLMVVTMTLSDVLNNVATALIAAPVAVDVATTLNVNPDTFLMGVAVAASCAFLTPIGHKNNTIIMGPGGYRFGDYWRMGLPLECLVLAVGIPALLLFWPLGN